MSYEKVENTFFEAFEGQYVRALITGPTKELVERAAYDSTSTQVLLLEELKVELKDSCQKVKLLTVADMVQ